MITIINNSIKNELSISQENIIQENIIQEKTKNEDILSPQLVKQLQERVSLFDIKKDRENFNNILAKFI